MNLRAPALRSELNEPQDDGSARRVLLELYRAGLQAVDGERRVAEALREDAAHSVAVIALGKAGAAMMRGAAALYSNANDLLSFVAANVSVMSAANSVPRTPASVVARPPGIVTSHSCPEMVTVPPAATGDTAVTMPSKVSA